MLGWRLVLVVFLLCQETKTKTKTKIKQQLHFVGKTALFKLNGAVSAVGGIPFVSISPKARKVPTYGTRRYLVS